MTVGPPTAPETFATFGASYLELQSSRWECVDFAHILGVTWFSQCSSPSSVEVLTEGPQVSPKHIVLFIEALLKDIQIVVLLPEAVGLDKVRPHHLGQRPQVRVLFYVPQGGERHTKQFVLKSGGTRGDIRMAWITWPMASAAWKEM